MFIEFKNSLMIGKKISINVNEVSAFLEQSPEVVNLHMTSGTVFQLDETYRSVKTKINNALKRIAKGSDSETEIETT